MKNILLIIGLFALLAVVFYFTQGAISGTPLTLPGFGKSAKMTVNNHTFTLTVADTEKKKEIGLSGQKSLAKNKGMLFPYETKTIPAFWMRNMKFPIDILFISDGKIVTLYKNVKPPVTNEQLTLYQPSQPVDAVVEINAGLSEQFKLNVGDTATISL